MDLPIPSGSCKGGALSANDEVPATTGPFGLPFMFRLLLRRFFSKLPGFVSKPAPALGSLDGKPLSEADDVRPALDLMPPLDPDCCNNRPGRGGAVGSKGNMHGGSWK